MLLASGIGNREVIQNGLLEGVPKMIDTGNITGKASVKQVRIISIQTPEVGISATAKEGTSNRIASISIASDPAGKL